VTFSSTVPKGNMVRVASVCCSMSGKSIQRCSLTSVPALQALYRAKRQQIDNVNMPVVTAHQGSLAKEEHEQLALLGPLYAGVILEQSPYTQPGMRIQPHQDLLFFEALYKVTRRLVDCIVQVHCAGRQGAAQAEIKWILP